nr:cysteine hydrolase [Burkholderiales bacterium]
MKQALVLIDLQCDYLAAAGLQPAAPLLVDIAARLLALARARGVPVVHVWTTVERDPDLRMKHWKARGVWKCEAGTAGHAPPAVLAPTHQELIVHKAHFSGFGGTLLDGKLRELQAGRIVVAGLHLHACVRTTVLDACQRGLEVRVVEDAVASDDPVDAAATRRYLERRGVDFVTLEAAFAEGDAPAPA